MRLPIALRSIEPLVKGPLLDLFGLNVSSCFLPPSHKSGATGSRIPFLVLVATAEDEEEGAYPHLITNYRQGDECWPVWLSVQASAAAPGYFPPVCVQGKHYIDGGLVANNPTKIAIEQALNLLPR